MELLTTLQDIRDRNLGDRHSSLFYWALCAAISEVIGASPANDIKHMNEIMSLRKEDEEDD